MAGEHMAKVEVPAFYEIKRPGDEEEGGTFVSFDQVMNDAGLRGEVVASLIATAERLEAQAAGQRKLAHYLKSRAPGEGR